MSTSETDHYEVQECPCGQGHVMKTIVTQDNPWSSADISFSINCVKCQKEWAIENKNLINISSALPFENSSLVVRSSRQKLVQLTDPMVDDYFKEFSAKSMKAELRELERLGISNASYDSFRKAKNYGKKLSEICNPFRNREWLVKLAQSNGAEEKFNELSSLLTESESQRDLNSKQIISVAIQE
jgi:hypothetical protein